MKLKKRNKRTRARGSRSGGWGFRKKKKGGLGNKGGAGWSGSLGQKQQKAQMHAKAHGFEKYIGKKGFTSASTEKSRNKEINLSDIKSNFFDGKSKIDLKDYKILGEGEGFKAEIIAKSASKSAIAKMEKVGGKIILPEPKKEKKVVEKKENVEVKKVVEKKK
jgi:ribosomal protein L15